MMLKKNQPSSITGIELPVVTNYDLSCLKDALWSGGHRAVGVPSYDCSHLMLIP